MTQLKLMKDLAKNLSQLSVTIEAIVTNYKKEQQQVITKKDEVSTAEEIPKGTKETKKVTLEVIRAVLIAKVKELLDSFGANKLSSVKEEDFDKLFAAAQTL
jgi:hypothetical protein